jgi:hypothetical protein
VVLVGTFVAKEDVVLVGAFVAEEDAVLVGSFVGISVGVASKLTGSLPLATSRLSSFE